MAIRSFTIQNVRGLRQATFDDLPDLVAIAGANGVGKSTLLDQLFRRRNEFAESGTRVLYIGPNRSQRRAPVSAMGLFALRGDLVTALATENQPNFSSYIPNDWRWSQGQARGLDSPDESYALVKYEINRLEALRREALSQIHEERGAVPEGAMPDVFQPLRLLTQYLLPHLRFLRVDQGDSNDYKCLFTRSDAGQTVELDLDELSSGEKAIIALFMPFLTLQIKELLVHAGVKLHDQEPNSSITALIDEPEIHLHPTLQSSLVAYLRQLTRANSIQFILATHSPTMLDAMSEPELFMIVPTELAPHGNQFRRVVHADERLEAIRSLTGSTSVVTRARPIVFMEGETQASRTDSDQSLLGILVPESASWVVVPARGRVEAMRHARQLQETLAHEMPGLPIFALVDLDRQEPDDETMVAWPVCMIENLLLDPGAIWALLEPYVARLPFAGVDGIETSLLRLARNRRRDEIWLRAQGRLGRVLLRPSMLTDADHLSVDIEALEAEAQRFLTTVSENAASAIAAATKEVDEILTRGEHLSRFRGKQLLNDFYSESNLSGIFSKQAFIIELARQAAGGERLKELMRGPVARIQRYVPRRLLEVFNELPFETDALSRGRRLAEEAIASWEDSTRRASDLDLLRSLTHQVIRSARDNAENALADELAVLVPRFGLAK